ncbi:MAG: exo-alpha-sialidase [Candidatus Lokiarchaeota archaeon]|nr:exo-alpha-sialidase [Candidatus Lokiarchaeota archaeon]
MFQSWEVFSPYQTGRISHGSTLAQFPNGNLITAWYSGSSEGHSDVGIYASTYNLLQKSWSLPRLIEKKNQKSSEGNPVFFFDDKTDRLWLFWVTMDKLINGHLGGWSTCRIKCKHSMDFGKTWSKVRYLHNSWGWMTRNKPIRMSNGNIMLPIYIELLRYKSTFLVCPKKSFEKGAIESKWVKMANIGGGVLQPTVIELSKGHLLAYHRTAKRSSIRKRIAMSESVDFGKTWSLAIPTPLPNPNSGSDMVKLRNGNIVLAFNNSSIDRSNLSIGLSYDNGNTWSFIKLLEREKGQRFSYPAIIEASDETIYCTYTNKRMNIKCVNFDQEWIRRIS